MYKSHGIQLKDQEVLIKLDQTTGEVFEVKPKANNIPKDKDIFFSKGLDFSKYYTASMEYLANVLTPVELKVVVLMINRSQYYTNSLAPLTDDTSIAEIASVFKIHRNSVIKIFKRLKYFGVYGILDVSNQGIPTNTWLLNPYISFKGKAVSDELIHLFGDTFIATAVKSSRRNY